MCLVREVRLVSIKLNPEGTTLVSRADDKAHDCASMQGQITQKASRAPEHQENDSDLYSRKDIFSHKKLSMKKSKLNSKLTIKQ